MSLIYIANPQWTMNDEQTYWSIVYPTYPELTAAPAYFGLKKLDDLPPLADLSDWESLRVQLDLPAVVEDEEDRIR